MRIVLIGVSHWHVRHYLNYLPQLADIEIVGVSDSDPIVVQKVAKILKCRAWTDYRDLCDRECPDFAFAFGRHSDMPSVARNLIERGIGFSMEKPCGTDPMELRSLARQAERAEVFASVAFIMRLSPMLSTLREFAAEERMHYLSFTFVAGLVERYRESGVEWMLRRETAGGGCLINVGIHCVDLCRVLFREEPVVVGSAMSNALAGLDVEDSAMMLLKGGSSCCYIETGYSCPPRPGGSGVSDIHLSFRTDRHYFIATDFETFEILDEDKNRHVRKIPTTNQGCYIPYMHDVLQRVRLKSPPIANFHDAAAAVDLIQKAYAMSPLEEKVT